MSALDALKRLHATFSADTTTEGWLSIFIHVLIDEITRRESTSPERRATVAALDPAMRVEHWDKGANVRYDKGE